MRQAKFRDVIVLGAGAAGMMCAIEAGRRGRNVLLIDHAKAPGEKIRISGGGRCNFTNIHSSPKNFLSQNPYFAISALSAYKPVDFITMVDEHGIAWHEKTLGQLFCDDSARQIIAMLTSELSQVEATLSLSDSVSAIERGPEGGFCVTAGSGVYHAASLVIATGGKSIPKMGATGFGYEVAEQFGHKIVTSRPGLVPFTWPANMVDDWAALSGVSAPVRATCNGGRFDEAMLITHRGLSGPAMLQISSYWREGESITIDLSPGSGIENHLISHRGNNPRSTVETALGECLPRRLIQHLSSDFEWPKRRLADLSNAVLQQIAGQIHAFCFSPGGTEGYRTAEVTLGGVDTAGLSQKTMESRLIPGLYFIGEVVDVTGHLGGHNFQWAWASGHAAGRAA